jgi:hypothetical protein
MSNIEVKILLDSIGLFGNRLTTWVLKYPRFIHSEFLTHRMLSKNAASSRAIPFKKLLQTIQDDPATPEFWGANQKGMQSVEEVKNIDEAKEKWLEARDSAIIEAQKLNDLGLHKQIVNRVLEPFCHMTVICSGTDFQNFFRLRAHKDAQPEFQVLSYKMLEEYNKSNPQKLETGEWHIPFGDKMPEDLSEEQKKKVASARCARISYLTFDGELDIDKDLELFTRLAGGVPKHLSPLEHSAQVMKEDEYFGNFRGFKQFRKFFSDENLTDERVLI